MGNPFRRLVKFFRRLTRGMHPRKRKAEMEKDSSVDTAGESDPDSSGDGMNYPLPSKSSRPSLSQACLSATGDSDNTHCIVASIGPEVCDIRGLNSQTNNVRPDYNLQTKSQIKIPCPYGDTWDNAMLEVQPNKKIVTGSFQLDASFNRLKLPGYHPQKVLKSGDFSAIVLVYSEVDKKHTVLKMLHPRHEHVEASGWTSPQDQLKCKDRMQQVKIHSQLKHPNVIEFLSYQCIGAQIVLNLEHCQNGNLLQLMNRHFGKVLPQGAARKYFRDLISGVEYIHQHCIVHLDLRPENLFINQFNQLKVADFAVAGYYKCGDDLYKRDVGMWGYKAPETIYKQAYNPRLVDIWAVGCILFNMISGKIPYLRQCKCCHVLDNMKSGIQNEVNKTAAHVPNSLNSLLESILKFAPSSRATLGNIKSHDWVKSARNATFISGSVSSCCPKKLRSSETEVMDKIEFQL